MPVYFDLQDGAPAGDADARVFVVGARRELGGASVTTPPVLFMNAKGEVLGEVDNFATEDQVYGAMLAVLEKHPAFAEPSAAETALVGLERALWLFDLGQLDRARASLDGVPGDAAQLLLARIARHERAWAVQERHLAQIGDAELALDVRLERAYALWFAGDMGKLRDHLEGFPREHRRFAEAQYRLGLAHYHGGESAKALEVWKALVVGCPQNPWVYRADWAYTSVKSGSSGGGGFSTAGPRSSPLNRIGYMGRSNPDLEKPGK